MIQDRDIQWNSNSNTHTHTHTPYTTYVISNDLFSDIKMERRAASVRQAAELCVLKKQSNAWILTSVGKRF